MLLTVNNFPEIVVTTSIYRWHTLILGTLLERVLRDRESTLDTAYSKFFYPLKDFSPSTKCVIAGSIRREKPLVHDIDLLVVSKEKEIIDWCRNQLTDCNGYFYLSGKLDNIDCQIWFCDESNFGPALLKWTGPQTFNRRLCIVAKQMGGTLSELGLFKGSPDNRGERIDNNTEGDIIWKILHRKWIHPRDRF